MPTISVIVPVYKVEKYIHRCVDSILSQTFLDFELILVDDGSPDNSGAICDDYAAKDSRVRVIHKENGGLSSARHAGIDAAQGEYLFFLDSDDMINRNCLIFLYRNSLHYGADISMGNLCRFDMTNVPSKMLLFAQITTQVVCWTGEDAIKLSLDSDVLISRNWISSCCKLFKKALFQHIRFPVGKLFEDVFTTYQLYAKSKRIVFVDEPLYFYFVNQEGITGNLSVEKRFDEYEAQWERLNFLKENCMELLYEKALLYFLRTTQWDLIALREGNGASTLRSKQFERQYHDVWRMARKQNCITLSEHFDYYILANPRFSLPYRVLRLLSRMKKYICSVGD